MPAVVGDQGEHCHKQRPHRKEGEVGPPDFQLPPERRVLLSEKLPVSPADSPLQEGSEDDDVGEGETGRNGLRKDVDRPENLRYRTHHLV